MRLAYVAGSCWQIYDLACLFSIMVGVTGWGERHSLSRALEQAAVSVWKGFITSYGEHKAWIPWKQRCGFWDGTNKIGLFFHCFGESWPSEKSVLPSSFSPQGSRKSCKEQSGGGSRDGSRGAGSSGAAGHADALLQLNQTFSSACYLSVLPSVSFLTGFYLLISFLPQSFI